MNSFEAQRRCVWMAQNVSRSLQTLFSTAGAGLLPTNNYSLSQVHLLVLFAWVEITTANRSPTCLNGNIEIRQGKNACLPKDSVKEQFWCSASLPCGTSVKEWVSQMHWTRQSGCSSHSRVPICTDVSPWVSFTPLPELGHGIQSAIAVSERLQFYAIFMSLP